MQSVHGISKMSAFFVSASDSDVRTILKADKVRTFVRIKSGQNADIFA